MILNLIKKKILKRPSKSIEEYQNGEEVTLKNYDNSFALK
ncbi:hypothetical protein F891_01500 [Acinetobacter sp. CIP 101966]|jgi:hypothetical protein|nr:hypothetical protein F980_01656 [Acinetobacter lwoffii NIPH 715]ENX27871.1 hypothetical protein F891_01500 [Acinetobacter sp. CIP 101966]